MLRDLTDRNCIGEEGDRHEEYQYHQLIKNLRDYGDDSLGRNGVTRSVFGAALCFNLEGGALPLLTTKKLAWKTCLKELLWFLSGSTSNHDLVSAGVHIWDGNSSKEFLIGRGLDYPEGELGPVYGHQWRNFNGGYPLGAKGVDQIQKVIEQIKSRDKCSARRIVLSAWNPCQLDQMALPPCHILCQFRVKGNKLSCQMYQRSADVGLGLPFNIASYAFLTHLLAVHCGLETGELLLSIGDAHIYKDHEKTLYKQILRCPYKFPTIAITKQPKIDDYKFEHFKVKDYKHHDRMQMEMRP